VKVLERRERIEEAGAEAVFIGHDEPDRLLDGYLRDLEIPFPVLVDSERQAYGEWGLGRASVRTILGDPHVWLQYGRMFLKGERPRRSGRDPLQLGGDFVIDAGGVVAYSRPQEKDDRPPVGELLRVLRDVAPDGGAARGSS
jgi:hypothetical protein